MAPAWGARWLLAGHRRGPGAGAAPSIPVTLANASTAAGQFSATLEAGAGERAAARRGPAPRCGSTTASSPGRSWRCARGTACASRSRTGSRSTRPCTGTGCRCRPDQDGNPMDPVGPGATRVYEFDIPARNRRHLLVPPARARHDGRAGLARARGPFHRACRPADPLAHLPEVTMLVTGIRLDGERPGLAQRPDGLHRRAAGRAAARERRAAAGAHGAAGRHAALAHPQRHERALPAPRPRRPHVHAGGHRRRPAGAPPWARLPRSSWRPRSASRWWSRRAPRRARASRCGRSATRPTRWASEPTRARTCSRWPPRRSARGRPRAAGHASAPSRTGSGGGHEAPRAHAVRHGHDGRGS